MEHPGFFDRAGPFSLGEVARACSCEVGAGDRGQPIRDVLPLDVAGPGHVAFLDNRKYLPQLASTLASACFIAPDMASRAPSDIILLMTKVPYRAFAQALTLFYPGSGMPRTSEVVLGDQPVHPTAEIGAGVVIEHGAVIGREARIGAGTRIASGAVIGYRT